MAYTHITPGVEIEICRRAYEVPRDLDISGLVTRPPEELSRLEQDSVQKEAEIFKRLEAASGEWLEQAAETVSCRRALQYLRTPTPSHTSNARVKDQYGKYEISNMVYIMYWYTYENTRYDRDLKASVPVSWEISWHLCYNTPRNADRSDTGRELAGQDRKKFKVKADMEKYINGRIAAYAHLFTEISPPIPRDQAGRFTVNGVLLPGYTVEVPERTPQEMADSLLDFLEDGDVGTSEPAPAEPTPATPAKAGHHAPRKKPAPKRQDPVR